MTYHTQRPARRSPHLKGYDYAHKGAYFVTICVQRRLPLFGKVVEGEMRLNDAGQMVAGCWERLPAKFPDVELDLFCVMPNHFHGIVVIIHDGNAGAHTGAPLHDAAQPAVRPNTSLFTAVQWFKTMFTNAYMRGVREQNWEAFHGKLWQRSFHDHIIRSEALLNMLHAYSQQNPVRWETDEFYG